MNIKLLFILVMCSNVIFGQKCPKETVHQFFQAMYDIDTLLLHEVLEESAVLNSSFFSDEVNVIGRITKNEFIHSVSQSQVGELNEEISNLRMEQEDGLANVWMDYSFYFQEKLSHCGVNNFSLALDGTKWKILSIADSRRNSDCVAHMAKKEIDEMLDVWHLSAATADSTVYFDLMTANSIYVGTDKEEVWSKREFLMFAAPYFAKGKAWSFTKVERNVYSRDFIDVAWFDEVLDTWMGPCRGSGVVVRDDEGRWKIQHYVLSVAVANDDIGEYIEILDKK